VWAAYADAAVILCCPDKLRGSATAAEAAAALARGVRAAGVEAREMPLADGGEGTLDAVIAAGEAEVFEVLTVDALERPLQVRVAMFEGGRAVVEMAESAGHVEEAARDVMAAGTVGVGYAIHAALDLGARHVTVAAGGTGTVDGGIGALRALGARLLAADGSELDGTAAGLLRLAEIDASGLDPRLRGSLRIAADVSAPLCGRDGAARGFAPQKGADPGQVEELEAALGRLAEILGVDPATPGLGVAGGFPAPFVALAGAEVVSGAAWVRETVGFDAAMAGARLCITAEGRVDRQTALGKTVAGVVEAATPAGVPVVVVGGTVEPDGAEALYDLGAAGVFGLLGQPSSFSEALTSAETDLERTSRAITRLFAHFAGEISKTD